MYPEVTALVPAYRRLKYFKKSILSVFSQSYKDLELSIFDNALVYNTKDFVSSPRKVFHE